MPSMIRKSFPQALALTKGIARTPELFSMYRAQRKGTLKDRRLPQAAQNLVLILARSLQLKLNPNMLWSCCDLHILHHGMHTLKNSVYFKSNFVDATTGDFITADGRLQTKSLFRAP